MLELLGPARSLLIAGLAGAALAAPAQEGVMMQPYAAGGGVRMLTAGNSVFGTGPGVLPTLRPGTKLETGADGTARLAVGGDFLLRLGASTALLRPLSPTAPPRLELARGSLQCWVAEGPPPPGRAPLILKTPQLSITGESPHWSVATANGADTVTVHEGVLQVTQTSTGRTTTLARGNALTVTGQSATLARAAGVAPQQFTLGTKAQSIPLNLACKKAGDETLALWQNGHLAAEKSLSEKLVPYLSVETGPSSTANVDLLADGILSLKPNRRGPSAIVLARLVFRGRSFQPKPGADSYLMALCASIQSDRPAQLELKMFAEGLETEPNAVRQLTVNLPGQGQWAPAVLAFPPLSSGPLPRGYTAGDRPLYLRLTLIPTAAADGSPGPPPQIHITACRLLALAASAQD